MSAGRVLVYGGKGALGSTCISHFKTNKYWVGSVDLNPNEEADFSVCVPREETLVNQEKHILETIEKELNGQKLDAVFCVAGGWAGGNATKSLVSTTELMWQQSVCTSILSTVIASKFLKDGGLLVLTGAKAALEATPSMIGYGVAKAAVHHLTRTLAANESGLPNGSTSLAILPITLDTPMNRKWMPKADFTKWTALSDVAEFFLQWTKGMNVPKSGSLIQLVTNNSITKLVTVE